MSNVEKLAEPDINALLEEKDFFHHYQPLFDLSNWSICGCEALFRCNSMNSPDSIFRTANDNGKLFELDTSSISKAISHYVESKRTENLFVNIVLSTLLHPLFPQFVDKLMSETNLPHSKVVFELTQAADLQNSKALNAALSLLRQHGYRIAFDQVGSETASILKSIKNYPDYVKLDRYFSTDLSMSDCKQNVITMFLNDCSKEGSQLILKGIEQPDDLAIAKLLGVSIGQGYLLGMPIEL